MIFLIDIFQNYKYIRFNDNSCKIPLFKYLNLDFFIALMYQLAIYKFNMKKQSVGKIFFHLKEKYVDIKNYTDS